MPNYFARVELHDAEWPDDYEGLHKNLEKQGFTNCIKYDNGTKKRLPTAFYFAKNLSDDLPNAYKKVKKCASDTGYEYELVVIQSAGSTSSLSKEC